MKSSLFSLWQSVLSVFGSSSGRWWFGWKYLMITVVVVIVVVEVVGIGGCYLASDCASRVGLLNVPVGLGSLIVGRHITLHRTRKWKEEEKREMSLGSKRLCSIVVVPRVPMANHAQQSSRRGNGTTQKGRIKEGWGNTPTLNWPQSKWGLNGYAQCGHFIKQKVRTRKNEPLLGVLNDVEWMAFDARL